MHRKKILLVLGLSISLSLATPSVVFAADVSAGQTMTVSSENIETNNGTVERNSENVTIETNNGKVNSNAGTIETNTNTGIVLNNTPSGEVDVNNGTVGENDGKVETNNGMVESNTGGTIDTNAGTVSKNGGDIKVNTGTVKENNGVVEENQGTVNNAPSGQILVNNGGTVTGEGKVEINLGKGKVDETVTVVQQMWKLNYNNMNSLSITDCRDHDKANIYTMQDTNGKLQVWLWEDGSVIVKPLGNWDVMELSADNGAKVEKRSDGSFRISNVTRDTNLGFTLYNYTVSNDSDDNDYRAPYSGILEGLIGGSYTAVGVDGTPLDLKITFGSTNYDWSRFVPSIANGTTDVITLYTGVIEGASKDCLVTFGDEVRFVTSGHNAYVVFRDTKTGEVTYEDLGRKDAGNKLSFHIPYENCEFGIIRTVYNDHTHNTVMGAEVGMSALSAGNDFIGAATEGLALAANTGADGVSSFAQMGGGRMRQETG